MNSTQARREFEASRPETAIEKEKKELQTTIVPEVEKLRREVAPATAALRSAAAKGAVAYQDGLATGVFTGHLRAHLEDAGRLPSGVDTMFTQALGNINNLEPLANFPNIRTQLHNCLSGLRANVGSLRDLAETILEEAAVVTERIRERTEENRRAGGLAQPSTATVIREPERGPTEVPVETEFNMGGKRMGQRRKS